MALAAFCCAALPASGAIAADTKVATRAEVLLGWTDNATSSPDDPVPGVPEKRADAFMVLSPGVEWMRGSPGEVHRVALITSLTLYYEQGDANTWSNRAEYSGLFDLAPRTSMLLGADASATRAWTATAFGPATASEIAATAQGRSTQLTLGVDELLSHDLSKSLRGWQGARFAYGTPIDGDAPWSTATSGSVGLENSFRIDALGGEVRAEYGTVSTGTRQLTSAAVAIHRHDFGRWFTSRLEAGAMRVDRLSSGRHFWHPTALAALAYIGDWGGAELAYSHRATTSVQLGQTLLIDEVRLTGGIPVVGERTVVVAGSAAYQRGRVIEEDASRSARLDVTAADLGVAWQATPGFSLGVRYQYAKQVSDGVAPPDPLSYQRHSVLAGFALRLPPELEPGRPIRQPRRVDRSDDPRLRRTSHQQPGMQEHR